MDNLYVSTRELNKEEITNMLRYGDVGKIAVRTNYSYQYVSRVLRGESDNDEVWAIAAEYLNSLPKIKLDRRLKRLKK